MRTLCLLLLLCASGRDTSLGKGSSFTFDRIRAAWTASAAVGLFLRRSPFAVSGFIVPIIVNAVNGMLSRWPSSHISQKILKALLPLGANSDPAPAVPVIALVLRVTAAIIHRNPSAVLGSPYRPRFPVNARQNRSGCRDLSSKAPTALHVLSLQIGRCGIDDFSANADTEPASGVAFLVGSRTSNGQASKSLTRKVVEGATRAILMRAFQAAKFREGPSVGGSELALAL
jgi:hypothetical protein